MTLSPQFLDELRSRTLLSALIGRTTKLQKAGREWRTCCPFHNEKTPSFYVNDDKGFYHCFGCSAHGDAIRWMTDQRGLPFMDAVKELAQAAGMELPAMDPRAAEKAEAAKGLHEACADAASWFTDQLNGLSGAAARDVLAKRGVKPETARAFGIGFAPDSRSGLKTALKDYGDPLLVEAGLLIKVEEKAPYDRFRGRLMIPIRDPRGRTVAFGGRIIGDGEPKYLNSPETPLFDKGRMLFNLDKAAPASRKAGRLIVVEGYMDVIALAQAGFGEVVAPNGTAVTEAQLERMWRLSDVPILCLDGDSAGQKAAIRAAHRAMPLLAPGRSLAFVTLPQGQDPDDVVSEGGAAAFEALLSKPISLSELIWRSELSGISEAPNPDERSALRQRLNDRAATIVDPIVRGEYRETFRQLFSTTFYPAKRNLTAIRDAVKAASRTPGRGLEYALYRAVLLGLMRHPTVLSDKYEDISFLPITDRYLIQWRTRLLDIFFDIKDLSESLIDEILAESDIAPIELRCYQKDLAFSFYRKSSRPEEARRDLSQIIELLIDEHENKKAVRLAQQTFLQTMTAENFAQQQRVMQDAVEFGERLSRWREAARDADEEARSA